jgi:NADH:ubiquinone oxidoreductase subunit B-like Fe-S oxidoreductase
VATAKLTYRCAARGVQGRRQVLRTVYLPNERAEALIQAVGQLQQRLHHARTQAQEQMQVTVWGTA